MSTTESPCISEVTSAISRLKMNPNNNSFPNALNSSPQLVSSPSSVSVSSDLSTSSSLRFRIMNSLDGNRSNTLNRSVSHKFEIPIVGYEVIEERARFTVYKLRIQNTSVGDYWFVFRRYTDFVRLFSKLKSTLPNLKIALPRKRWFGDNFDPNFLTERIHGLQEFVNSILGNQQLCTCKAVRDFFCLDEPPSCSESIEESRAIFEALEETIYHLRGQLRDKDVEIGKLRTNLEMEKKKKDELFKFVTSSTKKCPACIKECQKVVMSRAMSTGSVMGGSGDGPVSYLENNHSNSPQVMRLEDVSSVLSRIQ